MDNCPYNYSLEYLRSLHTKQLLQILDSLRSCSIDQYICRHATNTISYNSCIEKNHRSDLISLLKNELSTRSHMKNKRESKEYRKALIKKGK